MDSNHPAGAAHGSLKTYAAGFLFSVVLTAVPFILVMTGALPATAAVITLVAFAVAQIVVHLVFFLQLSGASEQRWNLAAFLYMLVILAILVGASIWIMYHLNENMMIR